MNHPFRRRLCFPHFTGLPVELQRTMMDWIHDRHDPLGLGKDWEQPLDQTIVRYVKQSANHKVLISHWAQLRLVCREWAHWFHLGQIIQYAGGSTELSFSLQILERMGRLKYLCVYCWEHPYSSYLEELAVKLPLSLRRLRTDSAQLLLLLPDRLVESLEHVHYNSAPSRVYQNIRGGDELIHLFQKLRGRLREFCDDCLPSFPLYEWQQILADYGHGLINLAVPASYLNCLKEGGLPVSVKRVRVAEPDEITNVMILSSAAYSSVCELDAWESLLRLASCNERPLPALKCIKARRVFELNGAGNLKRLLPSLESLTVQHLPPIEWLQLATLKQLNIHLKSSLDADNKLPLLLLSELTPSLVELAISGCLAIKGLPPVLSNLRKFTLIIPIRCQQVLPSGIFDQMPALEELDIEGIIEFDSQSLLALRHSLRTLNLHSVKLSTTSMSFNVISSFTRLKRLCFKNIQDPMDMSDAFPDTLDSLELDEICVKHGQLTNLKWIVFGDKQSNMDKSLLALRQSSCITVKLWNEADSLQSFLCKSKRRKISFGNIVRLEWCLPAVPRHTIAPLVLSIIDRFPQLEELAVFCNSEHQNWSPAIQDIPLKLLCAIQGGLKGRQMRNVCFKGVSVDRPIVKDCKYHIMELERLGINFLIDKRQVIFPQNNWHERAALMDYYSSNNSTAEIEEVSDSAEESEVSDE